MSFWHEFSNESWLEGEKRRKAFGMDTVKYEFHISEQYRWSVSIYYLKLISGSVQEMQKLMLTFRNVPQDLLYTYILLVSLSSSCQSILNPFGVWPFDSVRAWYRTDRIVKRISLHIFANQSITLGLLWFVGYIITSTQELVHWGTKSLKSFLNLFHKP